MTQFIIIVVIIIIIYMPHCECRLLLFMVILFLCAVLVLMVVVYVKWLQRSPAYTSGLDAHDDVRENIIHYDEEGVGRCSC